MTREKRIEAVFNEMRRLEAYMGELRALSFRDGRVRRRSEVTDDAAWYAEGCARDLSDLLAELRGCRR